MPNQVKEQAQKVLCPLGFLVPNADETNDFGKDVLIKTKLKFDPETGSTEVDESETIDLVEMIQTYKDQCGVEYVQKLIKMGMATPSQFMDDGRHGGDASAPTDINDALALANAGNSAAQQIAKSLGMTIDESTTDQQIADRIKAIFDAANAPKQEVKDNA